MEPNKTEITYVTILLEQVSKKVDLIGDKVERMKDGQIAAATTDIAVLQEKTNRIEKIVYGACAVIFVETIGLILSFIK